MSVDDAAGRPLKIFINYRHADTQPTAELLYTRLEQHFGADNVFYDRGALAAGMRWLEEIKSRLAEDGVLIALIGEQWLSTLTANMRNSQDDDYVVKEIDLAFRSRGLVTVIPVLADNANFPGSADLPRSLKPLPGCQAAQLRPANLRDDIDSLIARLDEIRSHPAPTPKSWPVPLPSERPRRARPRQMAPRPDEDHYQMVTGQAGNLVVFLGAGANADDRGAPWSAESGGLPDDGDLAAYLASHVGLKAASPHLAEVAQYASATRSDRVLFDWVTQALRVDSEPGPVHRYLAQLPARLGNRFQMIVTPKYDAALERALTEAGEDFDVAVYMAPGTDHPGRFVHLPWNGSEHVIEKPNDYRGFPIHNVDSLTRTVIVRINGAVDDPALGFPWEYNCVITEDHYIDYMSGGPVTQIVPMQIIQKLQRSNYLFLGYSITDWRLRVFLRRISEGERLGRAMYWAVEHEPDALAEKLWRRAGVMLYQSSLTDYLEGLYKFLDAHPVEGQP
jgi:hypothetical protein